MPLFKLNRPSQKYVILYKPVGAWSTLRQSQWLACYILEVHTLKICNIVQRSIKRGIYRSEYFQLFIPLSTLLFGCQLYMGLLGVTIIFLRISRSSCWIIRRIPLVWLAWFPKLMYFCGEDLFRTGTGFAAFPVMVHVFLSMVIFRFDCRRCLKWCFDYHTRTCIRLWHHCLQHLVLFQLTS